MRSRLLAAVCLASSMPAFTAAQNQPLPVEGRAPRLFTEFVGTWKIDESASPKTLGERSSTLVIATTPTQITVAADGNVPFHYGFANDVLLLGNGVVLTRRNSRQQGEMFTTNVRTQTLSVEGDRLTVDSRVAVLVQTLQGGKPGPGHFVQMGDGRPETGYQRTIYRRQPFTQ